MALSKEQVEKELKSKNFILKNFGEYKNMNSPITIICEHGHEIETNMNCFRLNSFCCPFCDPSTNFVKPKDVPKKEGFRLIAFDNATEKMGVSIYDDGQLVYCDLLQFSGDTIGRLCKIQTLFNKVVIPLWQPDFLVFEDIQLEHGNVLTYKILAMLLGICETTARQNDIQFEVIPSSVWRSGVGVNGSKREDKKKNALAKVQELFNISVQEDIAEAILIGKYATMKNKSKRLF